MGKPVSNPAATVLNETNARVGRFRILLSRLTLGDRIPFEILEPTERRPEHLAAAYVALAALAGNGWTVDQADGAVEWERAAKAADSHNIPFRTGAAPREAVQYLLSHPRAAREWLGRAEQRAASWYTCGPSASVRARCIHKLTTAAERCRTGAGQPPNPEHVRDLRAALQHAQREVVELSHVTPQILLREAQYVIAGLPFSAQIIDNPMTVDAAAQVIVRLFVRRCGLCRGDPPTFVAGRIQAIDRFLGLVRLALAEDGVAPVSPELLADLGRAAEDLRAYIKDFAGDRRLNT